MGKVTVRRALLLGVFTLSIYLGLSGCGPAPVTAEVFTNLKPVGPRITTVRSHSIKVISPGYTVRGGMVSVEYDDPQPWPGETKTYILPVKPTKPLPSQSLPLIKRKNKVGIGFEGCWDNPKSTFFPYKTEDAEKMKWYRMYPKMDMLYLDQEMEGDVIGPNGFIRRERRRVRIFSGQPSVYGHYVLMSELKMNLQLPRP